MRSRRAVVLAGYATVLALVWPAASSADHISVTASVVAVLKERAGPGAWRVEVRYSAQCNGAGAGEASYFGNLGLIDVQTRERIYLGGVASASAKALQIVAAKPYWRQMRPALKVACAAGEPSHGTDFIEVIGPDVFIPPRDGDGGGSGGGSGGGGSGGSGGDPTEPPRAGGCLRPLVGTDGPDTLAGSGAGDVIFGRAGNDSIRGRDGHDCLIGGAGNDALRGESGDDRLTGGSGADTLVGGAGLNAYDAGSGNDIVDSVNGRVELVRCGPGQDRARVDRRDTVSGCERVTRAAG